MSDAHGKDARARWGDWQSHDPSRTGAAGRFELFAGLVAAAEHLPAASLPARPTHPEARLTEQAGGTSRSASSVAAATGPQAGTHDRGTEVVDLRGDDTALRALCLIGQAGFTDPTVSYRGVWHLADDRIIGSTK